MKRVLASTLFLLIRGLDNGVNHTCRASTCSTSTSLFATANTGPSVLSTIRCSRPPAWQPAQTPEAARDDNCVIIHKRSGVCLRRARLSNLEREFVKKVSKSCGDGFGWGLVSHLWFHRSFVLSLAGEARGNAFVCRHVRSVAPSSRSSRCTILWRNLRTSSSVSVRSAAWKARL